MGPKSAKSAKYRVFCGYTWKTPGIPGKYPATAWVSCRFPQFCVRFCPRPALRLRETREFPEWSTKHPLFSLEISGNAKCWGPSVFLFVCRKSLFSPICNRVGRQQIWAGRRTSDDFFVRPSDWLHVRPASHIWKTVENRMAVPALRSGLH